MKPVLFIDVDGVINIFPPAYKGKSFENGKHLKYWGEWKKQEFSIVKDGKTETYPFIHSPEMFEQILSLQGRVELVWLTTWQDYTEELLPNLLGMPSLRLPYLLHEEGRDDHLTNTREKWWKVEALGKYIDANPRPFLWFDDMYSKELRSQVKDIAKRNEVPGDLIRANDVLGITKKMIEQVKSFFSLTEESLE